ncbi:hypothetical protein FKM82_019336 [Ascaphus truei]
MSQLPIQCRQRASSPESRTVRHKERIKVAHDRRINIGEAYEDWMALKTEKNLIRNEQLAMYLIETYRKLLAHTGEEAVVNNSAHFAVPFYTEDVPDDISARFPGKIQVVSSGSEISEEEDVELPSAEVPVRLIQKLHGKPHFHMFVAQINPSCIPRGKHILLVP